MTDQKRNKTYFKLGENKLGIPLINGKCVVVELEHKSDFDALKLDEFWKFLMRTKPGLLLFAPPALHGKLIALQQVWRSVMEYRENQNQNREDQEQRKEIQKEIAIKDFMSSVVIELNNNDFSFPNPFEERGELMMGAFKDEADIQGDDNVIQIVDNVTSSGAFKDELDGDFLGDTTSPGAFKDEIDDVQ